jgi:CRP-like cAMP-binding protein
VAGRDLVHEGQIERAAYILVSGWVCSYKLQPDGGRQIIDFQIPGDFVGLRSIMLEESNCSFEAIVDILTIEVPKQSLVAAFSTTPGLARAILRAASRDEAMVLEHLVRLGRRDAGKRMAHFLLELGARLSVVELGNTSGYDCPLTQYHLADTLGLSAVHVNRVLRSLREAGLVSFKDGRVKFMNRAGLVKLADFDPAYLDQASPLAA